MAYPLEDLLAPNVLQPRVQVLNLLDQRLDMCLICALDPASLADSHVQGELNGAVDAAAQPSSALHVLRGDANAVLAGVGGGEGEFALAGAALGDDAVVVVESLLYRDEDAGVWVRLESLSRIAPYLGVVVSCTLSVLAWIPLKLLQQATGRSYRQPRCPWGAPRRSTSGLRRQ
jgi:hypothetical protein